MSYYISCLTASNKTLYLTPKGNFHPKKYFARSVSRDEAETILDDLWIKYPNIRESFHLSY